MANPNMKVGMPSVNPKGRPSSVFQDYPHRAAHFMENYSRGEIIAISESDDRLDEHSSFDAMVLMQLGNSLKRIEKEKIDPAQERERLYDRASGKPQASVNVNHSGAVAVFTADISPITDFLGEFTVSAKSPEIQADVPGRPLLPAEVRS